MAHLTGSTRNGGSWTPAFLVGINQTRCIGCGRCFKVCPRQVLELVERTGTGDEEEESDWEDGFSDDTRMVMSIADAGDCIGCGACSRVCPKKCHRHAALELAA
ncbi:MAG: ferredoxin III, nif-specific [Magnetococcales bacterium]|nr:ferredoxin III, nif-specific [Magnetococcales bacterium]